MRREPCWIRACQRLFRLPKNVVIESVIGRALEVKVVEKQNAASFDFSVVIEQMCTRSCPVYFSQTEWQQRGEGGNSRFCRGFSISALLAERCRDVQFLASRKKHV
jgi:hypothetical protein